MLKWLVLALLIVNVAVFGWIYDRHIQETVRQAGGASPIPPGTPALVLVGELDQLPAPRDADAYAYGNDSASGGLTEEEAAFEFDDAGDVAAAAPPPEDAPVREIVPGTASSLSAGRCYRAGPYLTRDAYAELLEWLRERTVSVSVTSASERTRQLYWVYLEALDAEAAAASIEDFKQQGIEDYLLVRRGGINNDAISLGLFSSQDAVNRRLAEMNEKGYQPVVVPRWETRDNYFLTAELAAGYEDLADVPLELSAIAPIEEVACGGGPPAR